jgi:glycosyltransferase involved in cell wall biosynthesis
MGFCSGASLSPGYDDGGKGGTAFWRAAATYRHRRALARRPQLLILDEVTTALDPVTEAGICEVLRNLSGTVTIISISHQPAMMDAADIVYHVCGGDADLQAAYNGGLAAKLARIPLISHIRSRYSGLSRRDQLLLAPVSHFVFVSRETKRKFGLQVSSSRSSVVYDGLDIAASVGDPIAGEAFRREFDIGPNVPVIGMLARVAEVKDYFTLARAMKRVILSRPDAIAVIVGDHSSTPNYRAHYAKVRSFISDLELTKNFVFTGHRTDVNNALSAMDVFVLSTHLEGLPLVLIEAAAHSLPIVATDVDGVPEIITHGETGLLAPHSDEATLAGHLLRLLDDPAYARRLGNAAYVNLLRDFGKQQFADGMAAVYCRFLSRSGQVNSHSPTHHNNAA